MSNKTKIEWTEQTWNPTTGCTKISPGCQNCYAEVMAHRLQAMNVPGYENGFEIALIEDRLIQPLKRKKPTKYFVNSMSDLFHEGVPDAFIDKVIEVIEKTPHHVYQILTKRAYRMTAYFENKNIPKNAWLGVTVEDKDYGLPRIDQLRSIDDASIKFLSIEPLLEDLGNIQLEDINWVIVGGESGKNARPMKEEWVINIRDQCCKMNIAFFFKQWGGWGADGKRRSKKQNGRILRGEIFNEMPL
ncbi:MAG: phage Gp37/Gp68 family protein [Candidatus Electrothrix sp. EH2]|nr:phage Gp37/Gp68 family protein [Candidatus Electrothrix sp. EH2]